MERFKLKIYYDEEIEDWLLWFLEETELRRKRHRSDKNQRKFEKKAVKCWKSIMKKDINK